MIGFSCKVPLNVKDIGTIINYFIITNIMKKYKQELNEWFVKRIIVFRSFVFWNGKCIYSSCFTGSAF